MESLAVDLKSGHVLTVSVAVGDPPVHVQGIDDVTVAAYLPRGTVTFGPYLSDQSFQVTGRATVSTALSSMATQFPSLLMAGNGAPVAAVRATATVNPAGDDNGLVYTARQYGAGGNTIAVQYVDPAGNSKALSVRVEENLIRVSLATNGGGTITSTAAQVKAAIEASAQANALVSIAIMTADTGTADDGSGVVTAMARTTLSGGAGTGIGSALPGAVFIDTTNAFVYRNSGSRAVPAWTKLGDAA